MESRDRKNTGGKPEELQTSTLKRLVLRLSTFLKYGTSSGISLGVDYGLFVLLHWLGLSILLSTYGARACSSCVNFILNRNGVFRSGGDYRLQFIQYVLLVILSSTVSGLAVTFLAARFQVMPVILKFCVETVLFFFNYFIQKKIIFRSRD